MKRTQLTTSDASVPSRAIPICRTVPLQRLPNLGRDEMAYCAIPDRDPKEQLLLAFRSAPQFSRISPETILEHSGANNLRVILLGESDYYIRQAAAYLTALAKKHAPSSPATDNFWNDFDEYLDEEDLQPQEDFIKNSLVVLSSSLLDPTITTDSSASDKSLAAMHTPTKCKQVDLTGLNSAGVLVSSRSGAVLSEGVLDALDAFLKKKDPQHLFIGIKASQLDRDLLEELRFTYHFQTCCVGQADIPYLRQLMTNTAREMMLTFSPTANLDYAIAQLRLYRGPAFEECDLEQLLHHCARRKDKKPLETSDLLFPSFQTQETTGHDALQAMVGLTPVKESLKRLLAANILDDRRRMHGVDIPHACRNLAFSGSPGTGKSVTARLIAQILREEGCGSGRFVEAGREQLIGSYLGQTSPMIADLFRRAKGGVLFIDEAGALLTEDGRDCYATEAVNALVRHMELEPETMVIFATYPEEMEKLLSSNPGLSSRVAQVLEFPDYDEHTLFDIFRTFAQKESLPLPEHSAELCCSFFSRLRKRKGDTFGNGREARRLFQAAKEEMALRLVNDPSAEPAMEEEDLIAASRRLLAQEPHSTPATRTIGF